MCSVQILLFTLLHLCRLCLFNPTTEATFLRRGTLSSAIVLTCSEYRISDRQHDALKLLLAGNHVKKIRSPRTVLDLGAGKGAWAVEIAQEFATADEVVGVDIES